MSVASEITRLYNVRSDIFDAIEAQGVDVPVTAVLDDCPDLIGQISGGTPTPTPVTGLPANTIRCKFTSGYVPTIGTSRTQVSSEPNVWDIYNSSSNWSNLFNYNTNLIDVLGGNLINVTQVSNMFTSCYSLRNVFMENMDNITTSDYLFSYCTQMDVVILDGLGANLTNTTYMFGYCYRLTSVPLFDTSHVTNANGMFGYCYSLSSIPQYNTSSVTNMNYMFNSCYSLTAIPNLNTSNVSQFSYTFSRCPITTITNLDTSNATNLNGIFNNCTALTSIPLLNTSKVTNIGYAFQNCYNVQSGALALYQQVSSQSTPPTNHSRTFEYCGSNTTTGAAELAQIPSSWGGTGS